MAQLSKRKQSIREVTKESERQRKIRKTQEQRRRESSEVGEDSTALWVAAEECRLERRLSIRGVRGAGR